MQLYKYISTTMNILKLFKRQPKDLIELLNEASKNHDLDAVILLSRKKDGKCRVIAMGNNPKMTECDFAKLNQQCMSVSKQYEGIVKHLMTHIAAEQLEKMSIFSRLQNTKGGEPN